MELEQLDVRTSFFHGVLKEMIYMKQPERFIKPGKKDYVCKLKNSGLKEFDMKDLGSAKKILGMEIHRDRKARKLRITKNDLPMRPIKHVSNGGARYFVTFIDDFSRKVWVYFTKHKSKVFNVFKPWKARVEKQTSKKLKYFRLDNGMEYKDEEFLQFCKDEGIIRHFSVKRTPEQNGVAKRMNITLLEQAKCMRLNADFPKSFCAEAVKTACYLINYSPSSAINHQVPEENEERSKLDPKSKECIFLRYEEGVKGLFDMKDLGSAKKILGMEIHRDRKARKLRLSSQLCPSTEEDIEYMSRVSYANGVGCLMYAMVCTRPNKSHVISMVSRYMKNPGEKHWDVVKWIFRYLAGSTNFGIMFESDGARGEVSGFMDSDYAGDLDSRSSTTGYIFTFYGGLICWKSVLQSTTALSTTEAEYMALIETAKEALWLKGLVEELGFKQPGVLLQCDSQNAMDLAKNQVIVDICLVFMSHIGYSKKVATRPLVYKTSYPTLVV
ncbi:hypothetical protein RJ639_041094 [Escallonia herrerae]|uniref:Integrase catalytic domain-containing protein n=1 Tax=Escallonia herrerae TaxID=1293975 RepID=A0AA89B3Z8_9ASTE|nr:hypothetical protein RJ639_041094 [Escallonia herrerae]